MWPVAQPHRRSVTPSRPDKVISVARPGPADYWLILRIMLDTIFCDAPPADDAGGTADVGGWRVGGGLPSMLWHSTPN